MATATQLLNYLYKKYQGIPNSNPGSSSYNTEYASSAVSNVFAYQIYNYIIPISAPTDIVSDSLIHGGTKFISSSYPYIAKYVKLGLDPIISTLSYTYNGFLSASSGGAIPSNYDPNGTYGIRVYITTGMVEQEVLASSANYPWNFDCDNGVLTFYNSIPTGYTVSISFWRYEGSIGLNGLVTGPQGMTGYGSHGFTGQTGSIGSTGSTGYTGPTGIIGFMSNQTGSTGSMGSTGISYTGPAGCTGQTGAINPATILSLTGSNNILLNKSTGSVVVSMATGISISNILLSNNNIVIGDTAGIGGNADPNTNGGNIWIGTNTTYNSSLNFNISVGYAAGYNVASNNGITIGCAAANNTGGVQPTNVDNNIIIGSNTFPISNNNTHDNIILGNNVIGQTGSNMFIVDPTINNLCIGALMSGTTAGLSINSNLLLDSGNNILLSLSSLSASNTGLNPGSSGNIFILGTQNNQSNQSIYGNINAGVSNSITYSSHSDNNLINGSYNSALNSQNGIVIGATNTVSGTGNIILGSNCAVTGQNNIVIGNRISVNSNSIISSNNIIISPNGISYTDISNSLIIDSAFSNPVNLTSNLSYDASNLYINNPMLFQKTLQYTGSSNQITNALLYYNNTSQIETFTLGSNSYTAQIFYERIGDIVNITINTSNFTRVIGDGSSTILMSSSTAPTGYYYQITPGNQYVCGGTTNNNVNTYYYCTGGVQSHILGKTLASYYVLAGTYVWDYYVTVYMLNGSLAFYMDQYQTIGVTGVNNTQYTYQTGSYDFTLFAQSSTYLTYSYRCNNF